jgi:hypothetical protein
MLNDCDIRIVELRHEEREFESTFAHDRTQCFETRGDVISFPTRNDRLRFSESDSQFCLRDTRAQTSFPYEIATYHSYIIVQKCYITLLTRTSRLLENKARTP